MTAERRSRTGPCVGPCEAPPSGPNPMAGRWGKDDKVAWRYRIRVPHTARDVAVAVLVFWVGLFSVWFFGTLLVLWVMEMGWWSLVVLPSLGSFLAALGWLLWEAPQ